jgi:hypothetical protein
LGAFVIYQVIELRISQHAVGRSFENLFDLSICVKAVNGIKSRWAQQYEATYQDILIHLMRGINDDLHKEPFNEEMKFIAYSFAALLKPIVETVDQFGLKARHLHKHRRSVDRFYDALSQRNYQTELANGYRRRFEKYRDRLFTFLDYDGIPWNNNNAEHAIKAFVRLRNVIGANSTAKSMRDYLVLLSVAETCKWKGLNFLSFLRSGSTDIDGFEGNLGRIPSARQKEMRRLAPVGLGGIDIT